MTHDSAMRFLEKCGRKYDRAAEALKCATSETSRKRHLRRLQQWSRRLNGTAAQLREMGPIEA